MKNIITNAANATIMDTNLEVRSFHDDTMRDAFRSAVQMMEGAGFDQIGAPDYKHVRDFLSESIAFWMDKVGLHNKLASGYLALSSDNQREDLSTFFFSAGCLNNRLAHFLEMTAEHGAQAALKCLQLSVNNVIRDHLPSAEDEQSSDATRSKFATVSLDDVEGVLASPDYHCPERTAMARQNMNTFWQMLYEKSFIDMVFYLSQPLDMTREQLCSILLNATETLALVEELEALYADVLSDAVYAKRMFLPIVALARSYTPAREHLSNPKSLLNRLNRYTTEKGARSKFKAAFLKAIAA